MASTNPARGMRDFLPADVRKRNYVIGIIKKVYESYGFEPLETPAVENLETLMGKYGDEGNQLVFKILKRGDKLRQETGDGRQELKESDLADLALRYDLTVPLARVVANNKNDLPKFFKRYQIQPVWRADRPARGRFREFYQCDVDCIGSNSMVVEADIISAICKILDALGFSDFVVRINNRRHLDRLLDSYNVPEELHSDILVSIDKLDKIGIDGVSAELDNRGISKEVSLKVIKYFRDVSDDLKPLVNLQRSNPEKGKVANAKYNNLLLKNLKTSLGDVAFVEHGLEDLGDLIQYVDSSGYSGKVRIDPTLARGLSYYTGTIMEINVPDLAGSLGGGGRYDGLIGMFGKEQIPACGFSLGLERILVVMEERGMFPPEIAESTPADVLVTIWNEECVADSLRLANELRHDGLRVTLYPEADKLGKQFKYADSIGVPFVCVLGDDERAAGVVKLKNMNSGEEFRLTSREIAAKVLQ